MKYILTIFIVLLSSCQTVKKDLTSLSECSKLRNDLQFVHKTVIENSSNAHFDESIRNQASQAYNRLISSQSCSDVDYIKHLKQYIAIFKDPHLKIKFLNSPIVYNAGIFIRNFDGKYFVWDYLDYTTIDKGDELISCEGQTPDQIFSKEIIPYENVNSDEMFKSINAYKLFYRWDVNPEKKYNCIFKNKKKTEYSFQLSWRKTQDNDSLLNRFYSSQEKPIYENKKYGWGSYIRLSSMWAGNESNEKLLNKFITKSKKLKSSKNILIDLRGNGGGDSSFGDKWIKNLVGFVPSLDSKPSLLWASNGNIEHFSSYIDKAIQSAPESEKNDLKKYEDCISKTKDTFVSCETDDIKKVSTKNKPTFKGHIFVLTDQRCFSSCEIFLAELRKLSFVTHLGQDAGKSTLFGDVRTVKAPSGNIEVTFPQKVFFYSTDESFRKPHVELKYDVKMEVEGKDSLLDAAIQYISKSN